MRQFAMAAAALCVISGAAAAQTVEQRVASIGDGRVELTYAARAGACGDGRNYVEDGFGGRTWTEGDVTISGRGRPIGVCERGPVRVLMTVRSGQPTRLRTFVGPLPPASSDVQRFALSTKDAVAYLTSVAERADGGAAHQTLTPIVLADSTDPWPLFMRLAGDDARPKALRQDAGFWLSRGASAKLGIARSDDEDDTDDVRQQAVFALSQQPRDVAVPRLLEVAKSAAKPSVRASAIFWLGQSGDRRAVEWFGEVLGVR